MKTNNFKPVAFFLLISLFLTKGLTAQQITDAPGESPKTNTVLTEINDTAALGVRAILRVNKKKKPGSYDPKASILTFDIKTLAMQWYQAGWETKLVNDPTSQYFIISIGNVLTLAWKDEYAENRIFFDKEGFVYTASKEGNYVKVPFKYFRKRMSSLSTISGGLLPNINLPDGSVTYYGMDVSPKLYPVLEWAFVYKPHYFEGTPDFDKSTVDYDGLSNCTRYTLTKGKDKGSYVLFNSEGKLIEIYSINSGNIIYNYGDYNVTLPPATAMLGS